MNFITRLLATAVATFSLLVLSTGSAAAAPVFSYSGLSLSGGTFKLDVLATGAVDLYGYQLDLTFDASRVKVLSVTEGEFLGRGGQTFFDGGLIDNVGGMVSFNLGTLLGAVPGVTGSGVLESVEFEVLSGGPEPFNFGFSNAFAVDSNVQLLDLTTQNIALAVPEPGSLSLILAGVAVLAARRRHFIARKL